MTQSKVKRKKKKKDQIGEKEKCQEMTRNGWKRERRKRRLYRYDKIALKRKTSQAREEWAKLPKSSSMSPMFQQEQQRHPHFKNKRPKIIEQQPNIQQEEPKVTRRHDCKNFFNVVSSREKMDLIRMVTGATVTVDAKLPTVLVLKGRNGKYETV